MDEKERRRIRMKRVAEEFVKNVGTVIRQHRIDSGLSQDDLADGIVMGRSIIGKYNSSPSTSLNTQDVFRAFLYCFVPYKIIFSLLIGSF